MVHPKSSQMQPDTHLVILTYDQVRAQVFQSVLYPEDEKDKMSENEVQGGILIIWWG